MSRKTIDVQEMKKFANSVLASKWVDGTPAYTPAYRLGICTMIERVLMDSGNYKGYAMLEASDLGEGIEPGIVYESVSDFEILDETRRVYF